MRSRNHIPDLFLDQTGSNLSNWDYDAAHSRRHSKPVRVKNLLLSPDFSPQKRVLLCTAVPMHVWYVFFLKQERKEMKIR